MPEKFTPVTLSRASDYYALWEKLPVHSLDYSLVNLWGWQEYYGLEWSFEDGLCWIRQTNPCGIACWAPVGDWNAVYWKSVLQPGMKFIRIPDELCAIWKTPSATPASCRKTVDSGNTSIFRATSPHCLATVSTRKRIICPPSSGHTDSLTITL